MDQEQFVLDVPDQNYREITTECLIYEWVPQ
jgi:hypothetical protein